MKRGAFARTCDEECGCDCGSGGGTGGGTGGGGGGGGGGGDTTPPPSTVQCEPGWSQCAPSSQLCCKGVGCPSGTCGNCNSGWVPIPGTNNSTCADPPGTCPGQCYTGGGGTGGGGGGGIEPATVRGIVWEDLNNNNVLETTDRYWGQWWQTSCTNYFSSVLRVDAKLDSGSPSPMPWYCTTSSPTKPVFGASTFENNRLYGYTLTPPVGYSCSNVTWTYTTTICNTQKTCAENNSTATINGTGCTIPPYPARIWANPNLVTFKIVSTQKPVEGVVWEDTNNNGIREDTDLHWGTPSTPCAGSQSNVLKVTDNSASNAAAVFGCYGNVPKYYTGLHSAAASLTLTLTPPTGYSCPNVFWDYTVCDDATCTAKHTGTGTGCTATLLNTSGQFANRLNWRIRSAVSRTISGMVYSTTDIASCAQDTPLGLSGLTATAYNGAVPVGNVANVGALLGTYSISGLTSSNVFNSVCINGSLTSGATTYALACLQTSAGTTGFTCQKGSGTCAINCTPTTVLSTNNAFINFGFTTVSNDKWFTSIDGDVYSSNVSAYVATAPLGGFSSNIINTINATSIGGYGFAGSQIDTQTTGSNVSEKGGYGQRLSALPNYPFEDQWLNKFSFSVPSNPITTVPGSNVFTEGKVYSFDVAQFNTILTRGNYSFTNGNTNSPAAAIIYVKGSGTIQIKNSFTTANAGKILVLVTDVPVEVSKDVGVAATGLTINGASQIDLVVISAADISFLSQYSASTNTFDKPLLMDGSIMSRSGIKLNRNLGGADNASYPAESVRFYPYLLNLIQQYEIANGQNGAYTGLATIDVQFDYGN